jgi:hypothetical protein
MSNGTTFAEWFAESLSGKVPAYFAYWVYVGDKPVTDRFHKVYFMGGHDEYLKSHPGIFGVQALFKKTKNGLKASNHAVNKNHWVRLIGRSDGDVMGYYVDCANEREGAKAINLAIDLTGMYPTRVVVEIVPDRDADKPGDYFVIEDERKIKAFLK